MWHSIYCLLLFLFDFKGWLILHWATSKQKQTTRQCNDNLFQEYVAALKKAFLVGSMAAAAVSLTSETVQGASLTLQGVDNIHGGDCLPLGVLSVGDGITDDILQEYLQHTTGLFIDQTRDSLHTTPTGKTTDGWLGDTLDVITQNLSVTLGAPLSKTLASFTTSRHLYFSKLLNEWR